MVKAGSPQGLTPNPSGRWPASILVFFGFNFEVFSHFAEESHCEEASLIVLGDQSKGRSICWLDNLGLLHSRL